MPESPTRTVPESSVAALRRVRDDARILAMSFDRPASPAVTLRALDAAREHRAPRAWGFAWYPEPGRAAMVLKDAGSIGDNAMTRVLREWERFASTVFLVDLRGAARALEAQEAQPCARSFAGRDWSLAHAGDLAGDLAQTLPLPADDALEPLGRSDAERALCWLLTRYREARGRRLGDLPWATLHGWLRAIDDLGTANVVLSDGVDLVAYRDAEGHGALHLARLVPPHAAVLEGDDLAVDLREAGDLSRTVAVVSSDPLAGASWEPLEPGRMVVLRRGAYVFDSHGEAERARRFVTPPRPEAERPSLLLARAVLPAEPASEAERSPTRVEFADRAPHLAPPRAVEAVAGTRVLSVVHETRYRYATPVERSVHHYRLRPVHDARQELLAHELTLSHEDLRRDFEDVFGNAVTHTEVETPYTVLRVLSRAVVRVGAVDDEALLAPPRRVQLPLVWMPWQRQMMLPYLLPPELHETQLQELYEYALSFARRQDGDLLATLADLNATIFRDFGYVGGATTFETTPFEVYLHRRGVCQDFANLFICLARLLSIPARYRVGYLFTGADYANTQQGEASHAWAEVYLPSQGWVGFDPTNGCLAGADHVRVACGRNYRDATPTSGTLYKGGDGPERLAVDVRVARIA